MPKPEVYKSTTLGAIPLSFTGRHLLQNLREAMTDLISKVVKDVEAGRPVVSSTDWEPVSLARGKLAQYMSRLEGKERLATDIVHDLCENPFAPTAPPSTTISAMHLPPIPPGYALYIEDGNVYIEPYEKEE